jgi:hypothetical protein
MTPASLGDCERFVGTMYAAMAKRSATESNDELVLELYSSRAEMYPADVAKAVCMAFALRRDKPNWFPTLSEFDEACEKATQSRKALLESL